MALHTNIDSFRARLRGFEAYTDKVLGDAVEDVTIDGGDHMRLIVPHDSGRLAGAIDNTYSGTDGHHVGIVGVDRFAAPHALDVDRGTGIDGPEHTPVTIRRPARKNPKHKGAMRFQKQGEPARYRRTVKAAPSPKIERGKNFSGRTFKHMAEHTRVLVGRIHTRLAAYLASH